MSISLSASLNATSAFLADAFESASVGLSGLGLIRSAAVGSENGRLDVFLSDVGSKMAVAFLVGFITIRLVWFLQDLKVFGTVPGMRCLFEPYTLPGALSGTNWWNPGINFPWTRRLELYSTFNSELISIIPSLFGSSRFWTSNLDVARQIIANPAWIKPTKFSAALLFYGNNLGGAEGGEIWRRYRRIMGPAFNNKTYQLVWDETIRVYKNMISGEGWANKEEINVPVIQKFTFKTALFIISACGFGLPFEWNEPPQSKDGSMSLQEALRIVSDTNFIRTTAPRWVYWLPIKKFREVEQAHRALDAFMRSQVAERKVEIKREIEASGFVSGSGGDLASNLSKIGGRSDVFSRLVVANELDSNEKLRLTDEELIGNVFVLLFAGHETSGHTLAATLGYLAVYQEEQDIIYEQISSVLDGDRDPVFEDYPALYKVLCAFYETLRLIPAGAVMIRETTVDTVLSAPDGFGSDKTKQHVVPKGTIAIVDMVGVQYNPRYFPDPNAFKPSRWYEQETTDKSDAYTAFSVGPRACIGRRFAMYEAVAFLTQFLRDWKVDIVLDEGQTREQWREKNLDAELVLTLAVKPVPLKLVRRRA